MYTSRSNMPSLVPLDNTVGAAFVGYTLALVIYGITCLQAYLYYIDHSAKDGRFLKAFVAFLVLLDTSSVALLAHVLYWYAVSNYGDYEVLLSSVWSLNLQVPTSFFLAYSVEIFFAWRVYLISNRKNWWVPLMIVVCVLGSAACAVGFTVTAFRLPLFADAFRNVPWCTAGLVCELVADTVITISMVYYFVRRRTGFGRTDTLLSSLIQYMLNTCLLTTIFTTLDFTFFIKYPGTMLYTPFFAVLMRVYLCSFLSTLNTRKSLRAHQGNSTEVRTPAQESIPLSKVTGSQGQAIGPIAVSTTKHIFSDSMYAPSKIGQFSV